ncbi:HNH endonuclease signature motif containing protein [Corynebacterium sp. HMSC28B08]|uniref:HNH endonuclease signature motif containing protein n=1 Tax=Corynebacterium sp. HMSC28B08 TaxID=1581066 RepID=UPI001AF02102|nr:HNH endonuclease signature motif containing protein [Corynebacterium sp. HMSC28B08]
MMFQGEPHDHQPHNNHELPAEQAADGFNPHDHPESNGTACSPADVGKPTENGGNQPEPHKELEQQYELDIDCPRTAEDAPECSCEPSWRVLDPKDPLSQTFVQINKLHLQAVRMACPSEDDYIPDHNTRIYSRAGLTNYRADQLATIGLTLRRFPLVAAMFDEGAFCLQLMHRICEHLEVVRAERRHLIDAATVELLQPTRRNQAMRTLRWIDLKLTELIDELDPISRPIPEEDPDEDAPTPADDYESGAGSFHVDDRSEYNTTFTFTVGKLEGIEILRAVRNAAKVHGITQGAALLELIRGNIDAEVVLHLFQNTGGLPLDKVFGEGHWLANAASQHWLTRITHLAGAGEASNESYHPTATVKANVIGRDAHCRFPGCDVPAHRCQVDHVKRYDHDNPADGGPTATANLHLLCGKHHRLKTAGNWDATIHSDASETWTSHGDGHVIVTTPDGPLGRPTFKHRAVERVRVTNEYNTQRLRNKAMRKKAMQEGAG